jgi:hypothetical protein
VDNGRDCAEGADADREDYGRPVRGKREATEAGDKRAEGVGDVLGHFTPSEC